MKWGLHLEPGHNISNQFRSIKDNQWVIDFNYIPKVQLSLLIKLICGNIFSCVYATRYFKLDVLAWHQPISLQDALQRLVIDNKIHWLCSLVVLLNNLWLKFTTYISIFFTAIIAKEFIMKIWWNIYVYDSLQYHISFTV